MSKQNTLATRSVLVTGGAGYIGSHTCKALAKAGFLPVAYDNLSVGTPKAVQWGPLVVGDIGDSDTVTQTIARFDIRAAIHLAASAYVGESVTNPRKYFTNNTLNTITFVNTLLDSNVPSIVFSSTCATYGIPDALPITENQAQIPVNAYGDSKLAIEKMLRWYGHAHELKWIALRYFNAAGCDPEGDIGECHPEETHLIPLAIQAALESTRPLKIFGTDYPTPDGTAIRDFLHVSDIAHAHVLALDYLYLGGESRAFNLGTGSGHSVREVLDMVSQVTGRVPVTQEAPRRTGDPAELVADPTLAHAHLQWDCQHSTLCEIVETASSWFTKQRELGKNQLITPFESEQLGIKEARPARLSTRAAQASHG